jgi:mono/diheme cytochrome c family protein
MTRTHWKAGLVLTGILGLGLAVAAAPQTQTQKPTQTETQKPKPTVKRVEARPIVSIEGKDNFEAYCASCHGKAAKGDGPAAAALKVPPPDLTQLAKKHGGKLNTVDIEQTITGSGKMPTAHGSSDMPLWGPVFRSLSPDSNVTALRVKNLVDYIESIQEK